MEIYSRVSNAVRLEWPGSEAGFVYSTCTIYILVGGLRHVRATLLGPGFPSVAEDHLLFLRPWTQARGQILCRPHRCCSHHMLGHANVGPVSLLLKSLPRVVVPKEHFFCMGSAYTTAHCHLEGTL